MRLWKKIGNAEFDLLTVAIVQAAENIDEMSEDNPGAYIVTLMNGYSLYWSKKDKILFDKEMNLHQKKIEFIGAIQSMRTGGMQ